MKRPLYTGIPWTVILLLLVCTNATAATYYSIASGPWTSSSSWSLSSGGSPISSGYPGAGDDVIIEGGFTISIGASAVDNLSAANVFIGSSSSGILYFPAANGGCTLNVSGDITIGGSSASVTGTLKYDSWGLTITCSRLLKGTGTVSRTNPLQQDFTFTGTFTLDPAFNQFRNFIINSGTVTLSADITTNGSTSPYITDGSTLDLQTYNMTIGGYQNFVINGMLIVRGNSGGFHNSNFPTTFTNLTIGNNSTVVYSYVGNQSVYPATYNNLTLSGIGIKTIVPEGYVSGVTITNGGSGYMCGGSLSFTGGGGSGASGSASAAPSFINPSTPITSGSISNRGSGYTSAPTVGITGTCGGSGATATATMTFLTTATVNGKLTMGGTATLASSPAFVYGANSTLEYAGTATQTTGAEFPSTWSGSGGVIINNSNGVTLNAATTISSLLQLTNGALTTSSTNLLTISNTSTSAITGGSSTSFISGPLTISLPANLASGSSYTLPTGKSSLFMPLVLNNPVTGSGAVTITAEAFNTNSGGSAGSGILSISPSEYWSLASSGNFTGSSVSLTRPTALGGIDLIGESNTVNGAYASIGGTVSGNSVINSTNIGAVPQAFFVLGSDNTELPIKMSPLTASQQRGGIELSWITYSEEDVSGFDIERSTDGLQFNKVGNLTAKGANNITTVYNWLDVNAVTGNSYYRVKSIDIDGAAAYSQVVNVFVGQGAPAVSIYPNPVDGNTISLKLVNLAAGTYTVIITNQLGQPIYCKNIVHTGGSATYSIQPGNCFISGTYQLQFKNDNICETKMILKK